ncbi:uncharacterized protein LOC127094035 [Lathyrus oleraceus]|uniref:uncharacterized protein LOC127094035 n=1 Tax=Pisum sativum TaxID=3888 RepID=UPI0021CEF72D|nr:uncharacterized protein LOC127094035 [Pisum sativum]
MVEQEKEMGRVNEELTDIRGNIGQIMEMLQVIRAKMDTQPTIVSEIVNLVITPQPAVTTPATWPPFGLPYGFVPPPQGQSTQHTVPLTTEVNQVIPTFAPTALHTRVQPYFDDHQQVYDIPDMSEEGDERHENLRENVETIEKRLRPMEGDQIFGAAAREMCLVSGLVIPAKFKTRNLDQYEGATCPKSHLIMYYRKMEAHVDNDKLMIHCFQDSLKGASSKWYLTLDQTRIRCFQDLSDAFIKQYKYNMDLAPDRRQLLSMFQKDSESFKEYAQRWRETASQVEPPLTEKELAYWFVDTVRPEFFERMVGSVTASFFDLVAVGIKVELGLKNGKMIISSNNSNNNNNTKKFSSSFHKKKEGETNAVMGSRRKNQPWKKQQYFAQQHYVQQPQFSQQPYVVAITPTFNHQVLVHQSTQAVPIFQTTPNVPTYQQAPNAPAYQQRTPAPRQNAPFQNRRQGGKPLIPQIPMSYTELYPSLLKKGLVVPRPLGPPPDPLPPYYNPNAHCLFHEGSPGHDLEGCYVLKHIVRELIKKKILSFGDTSPNVKNNPLPTHGSVNAIDDESDEGLILDATKIKTPLRDFHAKLVEAGLLKNYHKSCEECTIGPKGCEMVRKDIQELINQGVLQVSGRMKKNEVAVIEPIFNLPELSTTTPIFNIPEPIFNILDSTFVKPIFNIPESVEPIFNMPNPVVVQRPSSFPFKNTKAVPWKYDTSVVNQRSDKVGHKKGLNIASTDIAVGSRMTRSGYIYTPQFNLAPPIPPKETTITVTDKGKEVITKDEDAEFLRIIKKSDYKIIDQLHQTSSKISILSLLMSSPAHRIAL